MPYLTPNDRKALERVDISLLDAPMVNPGFINYLICQIAKRYVAVCGKSYNTYNSIIGALECAKLEIYRRRIAEYEDEKIKQNGDAL